MKIYEGNLVAEGARIGVVCARFNEFIVSKLLSGCEDGLLRRGVRQEDIHVAWVPGAFEIPLVAARMAKSGRYDAVIALGAVIRGSTSHYDYVCAEVSKGVAHAALLGEAPHLAHHVVAGPVGGLIDNQDSSGHGGLLCVQFPVARWAAKASP